jgi:Rrf2 family protein
MKGFINLSESVLIAIHGLVIIASDAKATASSRKISEKTGTSFNTVSKVMQRLVKARFISSERGPSGGFTINKPASGISLYEIYTAFEGEPATEGCLFELSGCSMGKCIFEGTVQKISSDFKQFLMSRKLSHYTS